MDNLEKSIPPKTFEDRVTTWHFDRKLPWSLAVSVILQAVAAIWFIAEMKSDITVIKTEILVIGDNAKTTQSVIKENARLAEQNRIRVEEKVDALISELLRKSSFNRESATR